jgi:hypothetical protein
MTNATVLHLPESTATTITVHYADRTITNCYRAECEREAQNA